MCITTLLVEILILIILLSRTDILFVIVFF